MKKTFIYLAAAFVMASCAKNEVVEGAVVPANSEIIGFNTSTGSTRAADNTTADELKSGFNVVGLTTAGDAIFDDPTVNTNASSKFWFETTKWKWEKESDDKKWPANGALYPLQFIAAYPLIAEADMGPWATGGSSYAKAIEIDETKFNENYDLLAANVSVITKPVTGTTTLNFKHILSKIAFQIVSPVGYKVYIQSLTIRQVAKSGHTYDYKTGAYDVENAAYPTLANYNHFTTTTPAEYTGLGDDPSNGVVVNSNATTQTWKLMPQSKTVAWDKAAFVAAATNYVDGDAAKWAQFLLNNPTIMDNAMIEMVYRMEDVSGKSIVGWRNGETKSDGVTVADKSYLVKVAYALDLTQQANVAVATKGWLPAYSYTYQIKLGTPDATNGTVIDPNYKDDNGTDTDEPVDNPKTKPGEDITKTDAYIGFEVIVDAWVDNSTEIK